MEPTLAVELSSDAGPYRELSASLKRAAATLRKLQKRPKVDEVALRKDLEELPQRLKEVKEDLEKRHQFCLEILSQVETQQEREEFFQELQGSQELVETIKRGLTDTRQRVDETEEIIEILYRVSSSRAVLERVQDELARKAMARALTRCSVDQEKVFQLRRGLGNTLDTLKARGVNEALELEDLPAAAGSTTATGLKKDLRPGVSEAAPEPAAAPPAQEAEEEAQPSEVKAPDAEPDARPDAGPEPDAVAESSAAESVTTASPAAESAKTGTVAESRTPPAPETEAAAVPSAPPDPTPPAPAATSGAPATARPRPASKTGWDWKRWACLAGIFLAGVPLGYFLAALIRETLG